MTDRAIAGQRPNKEDIRILKEILLEDRELKIKSHSKEKAYFYPSVYVSIPSLATSVSVSGEEDRSLH